MPPSPGRIDLHTHSTASDGEWPPSEVVVRALRLGLSALSLTDHDTTDGLTEAQTAAAGTPLRLINGIELGTQYGDAREVHILGYFINPDSATLQEQLRVMRDERIVRAERTVARLVELGLPVSLDRVLELAGEGSVGRPHIAEAMVEAGHVISIRDAFDRYIGEDGPAYVPRLRLEPPETIALIHSVGGAAVFAHPIYTPDPDGLITYLVGHGLDGLEVYYPGQEDTFAHLEDMARRHNLIVTGGSDFHHPEADGSIIMGTVDPPPECVAALEERAARYR